MTLATLAERAATVAITVVTPQLVPVKTTALGDETGLVDISCSYISGIGDTGRQSDLSLPQSSERA